MQKRTKPARGSFTPLSQPPLPPYTQNKKNFGRSNARYKGVIASFAHRKSLIISAIIIIFIIIIIIIIIIIVIIIIYTIIQF